MIVETEVFGHSEISESTLERKLSSHDALNLKLLDVEKRFKEYNKQTLSIPETIDAMGFDSHNFDLRKYIKTSLKECLNWRVYINSNDNDSVAKIKFDRENVILSRVFIEFKFQQVTNSNLAYVAFHYLEDELIRKRIGKPTKLYNPKRGLSEREYHNLGKLEKADVLDLLPEGAFDFSKENVLQNIPNDFFPEEDYSFSDEPKISIEQLRQMKEIVQNLRKAHAYEALSGIFLLETDFTLAHYNSVVSEYTKLQNNYLREYEEGGDICIRDLDKILEYLIGRNKPIIPVKHLESVT